MRNESWLACLVLALAFSASAANTWWVAKEDPNASDANAGTEAAPFRTIQAALDNPNFVAGDTINVKRGYYDEGETYDANAAISNRVAIYKNVTIVGVEGAALTHIVGAESPGSTDADGHGRGDYATRCVYVDNSGVTMATLKNFTLRDGHTGAAKSDSGGHDVGGGLYVRDNNKIAVLVDCVISNCAAFKGAALRGGIAVRCRITENWSASSGVALSSAYAHACIIDHNPNYSVASGSTLVNCTLFGNAHARLIEGSTTIYNCLSIDCGTPFGSKYKVYNSVLATGAVARLQVVGPAVQDWRLVAGCAAATAGSGSYARKISGLSADLYTDYYGNPIPTSGTIAAGAVQEAAEVVAGGLIINPKGANTVGMAVNGHPAYSNDWVLATSYPTQFVVTATAGTVYRYIRRLAGEWEPVVPRMDDSVMLMPPPTIGRLSSNDVQYATAEFWVDPTGDDDNPGTAEAPFKTLQKGFEVARTAGSSAKVVVHAAAGDYREGGDTVGRYQANASYALTNRLCIGTGVAIRFKGAGAGQSFIWGAPDESSETGIGDAAIGCVAAFSPDAYVQGFTLTNGYTRNYADSRGNGAIAFGRSSSNTRHPALVDCVLVGGCAKDSLTSYLNGIRCRITGNTTGGTLVEYGDFSSCVFENNTMTDDSRSGVCVNCYGCSYVGEQDTIPFGNDYWVVATLVDQARSLRPQTIFRASVANRVVTWNGNEGVMSGFPAFVDPANGDLRVKSYSDALRCAPIPTEDMDWAELYWRRACDDVEGRPIRVLPGGHFLAGAVQEVVQAPNTVCFQVPNGGIGNGTEVYVDGEQTISEAISLTRADATRPCIGFMQDGVTNLFDDMVQPITLTPSESGSYVMALYTTDWYVDAENGADANSGHTPGQAKKTLAGALSATGLASGDTVHAAPGTYGEGVMTNTLEQPMLSRAIVPAGVTLLGDAGAEATIITGAAATESDETMYGCGSDAVRCVALHDNASLTGFTLTGGHTDCIGRGVDSENLGKSNKNNLGGGVVSIGDNDTASTRRVTECVISNNVAYRGGGAQRVSLRRCRVIGNRGTDGEGNGSGTLHCEHYGCIVANQLANYAALYPSAFCDSTLIQTNVSRGFHIINNGCTLRNSILACPVSIGTGSSTKGYYTVFAQTLGSFSEIAINTGSISLDGDYSQLQFDDDFRPIVGANMAIDAGYSPYAYAASTTTAADGTLLDISGGQRIYNGRLDAGALEADWRPTYATRLGGLGLTVLAASPEVVTGAVASVCIPTGTVTMAWANTRAPRPVRQTFGVVVTGTGTLTVMVDGETATYTAADGALKLTRKTTDANTDMVFAYEPGADDTGCAILSCFERTSGNIFRFR